MNRYTINVHFDMVVTEDVIADDLDIAKEIAMEKAAAKDLNTEAECVGSDACLVEVNPVTQGKRTTIIVNPELYRKFKAYAIKNGKSVTSLISDFIEDTVK